MRLDLFLKSGRIVKRRAIARELCDSGRVLVNNREAKPGKEVRPGDRITIQFSSRLMELEVLTVFSGSSGRLPAEEMYRVTSDTRTRDSDRGA